MEKNEIPQPKPYVSSETSMAEFTFRAVLLGVVVGVVFGAANAYLGLKVGLTVSASIPAAVIAVALFRIIRGATILESNMVQTVGSAGESLAAGVIFTLPALLMWNFDISVLKIFVLASLGGLLGVLFMIPLRRYLIVQEHGVLPYPEGTACAEVLIAGDTGGSKAKILFGGLGIGALYQFLMHNRILSLWKSEPVLHIEKFPRPGATEIGMEATPELLGVGFIIGPRISAIMLAGGMLGWLVLIPLIAMFGQGSLGAIYPQTSTTISEMSAGAIWSSYVRYIGAGAVAFGGFITLIKSLPTIISSFGISMKGLKAAGAVASERTNRDLSIWIVILGALAIAFILALLPPSFIPVGIPGALAMVIFAFFFVTVSSRIVGLIGSTSNPVSGMTIATLLVTSLIFVSFGLGGDTPQIAIISVGAVVCIAACIAGDTSQDLKTGYLVGATPLKQQLGEIIGVLTSSAVMGAVLLLLHQAYTIGSQDLAAPQATLMKLVIDGVINANLPWTLVFIGMVIALCVEMVGVPSLPLAVGLYLPMSLSTPIMTGGLIRLVVEKMSSPEKKAPREERGILFGSGLIAGSALVGVIIAGIVFWAGETELSVLKDQMKPEIAKKIRKERFSIKKEFVIGSDPGASLSVKEKGILPRHCRIVKKDTSYYLLSQGKGALLINGKSPAKDYIFQDGDKIQIGDFQFQFNRSSLNNLIDEIRSQASDGLAYFLGLEEREFANSHLKTDGHSAVSFGIFLILCSFLLIIPLSGKGEEPEEKSGGGAGDSVEVEKDKVDEFLNGVEGEHPPTEAAEDAGEGEEK